MDGPATEEAAKGADAFDGDLGLSVDFGFSENRGFSLPFDLGFSVLGFDGLSRLGRGLSLLERGLSLLDRGFSLLIFEDFSKVGLLFSPIEERGFSEVEEGFVFSPVDFVLSEVDRGLSLDDLPLSARGRDEGSLLSEERFDFCSLDDDADFSLIFFDRG